MLRRILLTVMLVGPLALALALPDRAAAGLHNAHPADASGDPADVFNDNDALFAYATSDTKGGYLCIVRPEAAPDITCDAGSAWGGKTRILGIGTTYTLIEFDDGLRPGHWRLQTVDSEGENGEAGGEFTVVPCPGCDNSISAAAAARAKAAAQGLGVPMALSCLGFAVKELNEGVGDDARSTLKEFKKRHSNYRSGSGFNAGIVPGIGGALGLSFELPTLSNPGEEKALEILKDLVCSLTEMYADIAADPPDPAFTTVAAPTFSTLPTDSDAVSGALMAALDSQTAFGETMLTGYERYQGAVEAGPSGAPYVHAQTAAVGEFGYAQVDQMRDAVDALRAKADALDTLPAFASPVVTEQRRADLASVYARVRTTGFTIDEIAQLTGLGLTSEQIDDARSQFTPDPSILPLDTTLQTLLRNAASALETAVPELEVFARSASIVAGRTNLPPTADFSLVRDPANPLRVTFTDTSTSPDLDPLTEPQWDFGDGATDTGSPVSHTFAVAGSYAVTITVSDGLETASVTRDVAVGVTNRTPTPVGDDLAVSKNTPATLDVLANDVDPDGDSLTLTTWSQGDHGNVACQSSGNCTYTPATGYTGPDEFTYAVSDGRGGNAQGVVSVTVADPNREPAALDDSVTTVEGEAVSVDVLANDSDLDADALTVTDWTDGGGGDVTCVPSGTCTYTPSTGFFGFDSFVYTVSDVHGRTASATVFVTVNQRDNTAPVATDDTLTTTRNTDGSVDVLANDLDPDGDPLSVYTWSFGSSGFVSCALTGLCTYTPAVGFTGTDSFTYYVTDNRGGFMLGTVAVTVADTPNTPPVAADDTLSVLRNEGGFLDVLENDTDVDRDALTIESNSQPGHGFSSCSGTSCSYSPDSDFFGSDSFTYTVTDGREGTATATVHVTVDANRRPTATVDELVVAASAPNSIDVLANDSDPDGDTLTAALAQEPANGDVSCTGAGVCTYTPDVGFTGSDFFGYTISDGAGGTSEAYVVVTVGELLVGEQDWVWRVERPLRFEPQITIPTGSTVECEWTFGDGTSSSTCAFDHAYALTGTYTASLTLTTSAGLVRTDAVGVTVLAKRVLGGTGGGTGGTGGGTVVGTDREYTLDADFDLGTLVNVNHDAPHGDELRLNSRTTPFPFVNIAASGRGTIVRIDVNTGEVLGEYQTAPDGFGRNPSRTTVDRLGNVWVTNRDGWAALPSGEERGTVARVGLVVGGERAAADGSDDPTGEYLAPPFRYNTCVDRDEDGLIHTSRGLLDVLPWPNTDAADSFGGVSTAADECILNYTLAATPGARTVAIDANNDAWVGAVNGNVHEKLDGDTGQPIPGTRFSLGCGGYGGVIDGNGILWSASGLLRFDTGTLSGECLFESPYGLAVDPQTGHIWYSSGGSLVELDPDGTRLSDTTHGGPSAQGLAVDGSGNVWISHSLGGTTVGRVRTDGTHIGNVPMLGEGTQGPTGVAVDANGDVWVANIAGNAQRIDPAIGPVGGIGIPAGYVDLTVDLGAGSSPYNYSDMTGFLSIGATSPQGIWRVVQDGGAVGAQWGTIDWNATVPAGTGLTIEARAADSEAALGSEAFVVVANGIDFDLSGRFIEVRATLTTSDRELTPALTDVRIRSIQTDTLPLAANDTAATDEDTTLRLGASTLLANDVDADGDAIQLTAVTGGTLTFGTVAIEGDEVVYRPAPNYAGPASFTYTITDEDGGTSTATVSVTVRPINDPPIANDDAVATDEDTPVSIPGETLRGNDTDVDGDFLSISAVSAAEHGTVVLTDGEVTFTPTPGYSGAASFLYTLSDGNGGSDAATVSVTVRPVNHAPLASELIVAGNEDVAIGVTFTGSDPENDALTFAVATDPAHGTLSGTPPALMYTPDPDYHGGDSFTYTASDGALTSAPATVTITVLPVNDAPVAIDGSVTTPEDTPVELPFVGADVDGDTLTFAVVSGPEHGSVTGGTYTPAANYHGPDTVVFSASDGLLSDEAAISITVEPVNDAPVAVDDAAATDEDTALELSEAVLLANDSDVEGDALSISEVGAAAHGTVELVDDVVTYTPAEGISGEDSFTYTISDGNGGSATAKVVVTVRPANDGPSADELDVSTDEDTPVAVTLSGSDPEDDPLTFAVVSGPAHGTLSGEAPALTYAPDANYNGPDSFTYTASDGTAVSAAATAAITVRPVNDAPVATDAEVVTAEDVSVPLVFAGTDADEDALTFAVVAGPSHGTLVDGTYTPAVNYHGPDSVTFRASDGSSFDDGTIAIAVTPVNDAPVAVDDAAETLRDTPLDLEAPTLLANDTDVDGDTLTITEVGAAEHGAVALVEGVVTYTPEAGFTGADSFTYTVSDGNGGSDTASVAVRVGAVNRAPLATAATVETDEDEAVAIVLAGTDPDGDELTFAVLEGPAHGTLSGTAAALTYTPDPNFHGSDSFSFRVSDGSLSDEALISITVDPVNDAPDAVDDTAAIDEDTVLELAALANDSDVDGDSLTIASTGLAGHGLTTVTDGKLVYTPNEHFYGEDSFTYSVTDGNGGSDTATVTVTVRPVSDAPVAADLNVVTDEDTPVGVALSGSDPDGDLVLGFLVQILPAHGTLSGVAPALTYTPDPDYHGPDSFSYAAFDSVVPGLISVPATVTITVEPVNDAPVAADDTAATLRDTPLQLTSSSLLANDSDVDGDTLTLSEVGAAEHGAVTLVDGGVTYTPAAGFTGADSFTYTVSDGNGGSDTASVAVRVGAVNRAPLATGATVATDEDEAVALTLAGTDADGDALTFAVVDGPAHGTLSGTAPALTYTPDSNFNGSDSFSFRVSDGLLSDEALVSITVAPVNDRPDAVDDAVATDEDTVLEIPGAELRANDADVDGDSLTISAVGTAGHGTVVLLEGVVTYAPEAGFSGEDSFTYTISDGNGGSDTATVTVTVRPANDGPSANDLSVATDEDTPVDLTLSGSDPEDDALAFAVVSGPSHGTLSGTAPLRTYTPDSNYFGPDSFTYTASDGTATSAPATVTITVRPENDAPQAIDAVVTTAEDTPLAVVLAAGDVDGDELTLAIVAGPAHGVLAGGTYTPTANYHGPDAVTFRVSDGLLSDEAVVDIIVTPVNDLPVADDLAVATDEDTAVGVTLTGSDADGDELAFDVVSGPAHGVLSGSGASRTYTPAANFNGSDSFTFRVSDGQGGSDTATVSITVHPINDPPVAVDDAAATDEGTVLSIPTAQLAGNDSDVDGDSLAVNGVGTATHGTVELTGVVVAYTPVAGYVGSDSFTYTISDGQGGTATATVSITVRPFQPASIMLAIDADSIDNGNAPNFFSQLAVNDRIARVGQRATLPAFAGDNVGRRLVLHTGQVGNEGWHALKTVPTSWITAGPTTDGLRNYLLAGPGLGSGRNRERLLDNVRNVTPLRATGLKQLVDQRVCAVVYDGDVSINYGPLSGSLKGENLGVVAFKVLNVTQLLGYGSSALPQVELEVVDRAIACGAPLAMLTTAPAPLSSSVPFDVVP